MMKKFFVVVAIAALAISAASCGAGRAVAPDSTIDTGYGNIDTRKSSISGTKLNVDQKTTYNNIYDYIRGKVPGVQVTPDNQIVIRGEGSFNSSNAPLILVDGMEVKDISNISPSQVKSITVLKDPSSTSIYGVRGGNGVIVIKLRMGD